MSAVVSPITTEVRDRIRRGVDLAVMIGGTLGTLLAVRDLVAGTTKEPLVAIAVLVALAACGFVGVIGRATWTPIAYIGLVVVANVVYLVALGPWIGLGCIYVLGIALAFLFMSPRWSWAVGITLVTTPIVVGVLHQIGVIDHPAVVQLGDASDWQRAIAASAASLAGVAIVVNYTVRQLIKERHDIEKAVCTQRAQRLERAHLDTEIARVRRADSIAQLAAEVGADIGAALAIIQARAAALRTELATQDAVDCLADITDVTAAAGSTMRSLTVFAPDVQHCAEGNASEAVLLLPKLVRRIIPMRITLDISADADLVVGIETGDLSRVFANLALNARDAIAGMGTITIRAIRDKMHALIEVADTGSGMGPVILDQLFQPFFTTKQVGRGTGLGLATTRILVERAKGTIAVLSEVGVGTTFTIRLPLLAS